MATPAQLRSFGRPDLAKKMEAKEKAASRPGKAPDMMPTRGMPTRGMPGGEVPGGEVPRKVKTAPTAPRRKTVDQMPTRGMPGGEAAGNPGIRKTLAPVEPRTRGDTPPSPIKSPGPHPSPNARQHANPNARFNRIGHPAPVRHRGPTPGLIGHPVPVRRPGPTPGLDAPPDRNARPTGMGARKHTT
jgi:hypothetical protein